TLYERGAACRPVPVVVGGLDQQPARVAGPGLGDRSLPAPLVRGALRGHDPQVAGEQPRVRKASEVTDFGSDSGCGQRVNAAEATEAGDLACERAFRDQLRERALERRAALDERVDGDEIIDEGRCCR